MESGCEPTDAGFRDELNDNYICLEPSRREPPPAREGYCRAPRVGAGDVASVKYLQSASPQAIQRPH